MADITDNESITDIVPKRLGQYLTENISSLKDYYAEFPASHRDMRMPSVSVITSSAEFRAQQASPCGGHDLDPATIKGTEAVVNWAVGIYDFQIQLDIWARNKEERDDLFDAVFNTLNPNIQPMGVVLKMDEYFGQLCDYIYVGHTLADSEERSQRDEWRISLQILATCKAVRSRKEFVIIDTPTASEIENEDESQIDRRVLVVE